MNLIRIQYFVVFFFHLEITKKNCPKKFPDVEDNSVRYQTFILYAVVVPSKCCQLLANFRSSLSIKVSHLKKHNNDANDDKHASNQKRILKVMKDIHTYVAGMCELSLYIMECLFILNSAYERQFQCAECCAHCTKLFHLLDYYHILCVLHLHSTLAVEMPILATTFIDWQYQFGISV